MPESFVTGITAVHVMQPPIYEARGRAMNLLVKILCGGFENPHAQRLSQRYQRTVRSSLRDDPSWSVEKLMQRARSISHVVKSLGATVWATIIFAAVAGCPWAMAAPTHPLDPLDEEELLAIRDILAHSGLFSANTNFAWIQLVEPAKKIVEDFRAGADFPRQASIAAIDYDQAKSFRVIIDLRANRIASMDELAALQPGLTERDSAIARDIVDRDPRIKEALTKRGFSIAAKVSDSVRLQYMAVGVDPSLDQEKNRLMRVLFGSDQEAASDTSPFVDGLMVIVDL